MSFEDGYEVWTSSLEKKLSMEVISKEFPSRVLDKLGRQEFVQKDGCKTGIWAVHSRVSSLQYTQELAPYMEEMIAA